jgi:predicted acetyltransferase
MAGVADFEIRVVQPAEYRDAHTVFGGSVHGGPADDDRWKQVESAYEDGRTFGAFEGGQLIGTCQSFASRMVVPGGASLPTALVSRVGVRADHTRRGLLTGLMRAQQDALPEPIAVLHASEPVIYGRFGYGPATRERTVDLRRPRAVLHPAVPVAGSIRQLSRDEMWTVLPELYERVAPGRPGRVARPGHLWERYRMQLRERGDTGVAVVHAGPDGADGYVLYRSVSQGEGPDETVTVEVWDFHAASAVAANSLWRYLLGLDLVDQLSVWCRPPDERVDLLVADPRAVKVPHVGDELWVRLVDVPTALNARAFTGSGAVVLDVRDPFRPVNSGRYRISAAGVERTEQPAQLALEVSVLGSLYLGDLRPSTLADVGRVEVLDPAAVAVADGLFRTGTTPWAGTSF